MVKSTLEEWIEIGRVEDIARLGARIIKRPAGNIALFRTQDDKIFAIDDKCPHKGGPLSQGIVHDCFVTCPLHNWVLDLSTGDAVAPDEGNVATHKVRVENGIIFLQLRDAASRPQDKIERATMAQKQCA